MFIIPVAVNVARHQVITLSYATCTSSWNFQNLYNLVNCVQICLQFVLCCHFVWACASHPPPKQSRVGSFFSHMCLVPPKFFTQRKSGFCRRYAHTLHINRSGYKPQRYYENYKHYGYYVHSIVKALTFLKLNT